MALGRRSQQKFGTGTALSAESWHWDGALSRNLTLGQRSEQKLALGRRSQQKFGTGTALSAEFGTGTALSRNLGLLQGKGIIIDNFGTFYLTTDQNRHLLTSCCI